METVLKTVHAALSKSGVNVGWVERSATHRGQADDDAGKLATATPDGGLHPPYGNLFLDPLCLNHARPELGGEAHMPNAEPDPFYFGYARPEVVQLVPKAARRVLDIGCGAGRLGEAIKQRQGAKCRALSLIIRLRPWRGSGWTRSGWAMSSSLIYKFRRGRLM